MLRLNKHDAMIRVLLLFLLFNPRAASSSSIPTTAQQCTVHQSAVRCRSMNVDHLAAALNEALNSLFPLSDGTEPQPPVARPERLDISDSGIVSLPNLFSRFNGSLRAIRVTNSGLYHVAINAFTGLEKTLRQLDLSGNAFQAVPPALQGLIALEYLDLSDNQIHVADGSVLSQAKHLRTLRLAYNFLGGDGLDLKATAITKSFRTTIGLDVLDLRSVGPSLEYLDLSNNWFQALPEVLRGSNPNFPYIRRLKLDHNRLADIPEDIFDVVPELQALHLDANLIRTIRLTRLPPGLKLFSLQENPLQCDCGIMWLLEMVRRNATLTLRLPPCHTPFYVKDLTLSNLYDARLCALEETQDGKKILKSPSHVVYVNDRDLGAFHLGLFQAMHLFTVEGKFRSIGVSWKVDLDFYSSSFNWTVVIRRFDDPIYAFTDTPFKSVIYFPKTTPHGGNNGTSEGESIYSGTIWDLEAGHFYVVCMAAVENEVRYIYFNNCMGAMPTTEDKGGGPAAPTPAPTQATSTTATTKRPKPILAPKNLRGVASSPTSINVTWTFDARERDDEMEHPAPASPLDLDTLYGRPRNRWTVLWRPFAAESRVFHSVAVAEPQFHIKGLEPGRGYRVCLRPRFESKEDEDDDDDEEDTDCLEIRTAPADTGGFTAGAVAAAGILSTCATAALAVAVVCCCRPDGRSCRAPPVQAESNTNDGTIEGVFLRTPRSGRRLTAPTIYPLATTFDIPMGDSAATSETSLDAIESRVNLQQTEANGQRPQDVNGNRTNADKT